MNIMHTIRRPHTFLRISLVAIFGLLVVFSQSRSASAQWATNGPNINNTNSGNVGIGITTPDLPLDIRKNAFVINGATRALIGAYDQTTMAQGIGGGIQFGGKFNTSGTTAGFASISGIKENAINNDFSSALVFTTRSNPNDQTERMRIASTGNVGIGTTGPTYKLHVSGNGGTSGESVLVTDSNTTTTAVDIANTSSGAKKWRLQSVGSGVGGRVGNFELVQIESDLKALVIQPGGNVGVGTINPLATLHVQGTGRFTSNVTVDGNINAKYQDLAEWVPATQALPPGTVVTLNPTKSNLVEASSKAYDTRVAGVISAQPGIVLGERGENKVLVATTGRVKVKADATNAPINIGDLLVTSDTSGMAMKSEPITIGGRQIHSPGTLIGKALEPLANGRGEILVLLSLQ